MDSRVCSKIYEVVVLGEVVQIDLYSHFVIGVNSLRKSFESFDNLKTRRDELSPLSSLYSRPVLLLSPFLSRPFLALPVAPGRALI